MIYHVLYRVLVVEFYKQNAALFGLLILVFFGFIKSSEHIAIGGFIVANPSAMLILWILWIVYLLKVLAFMIPAINLQQNHFLEVFLLLSIRTQITSTALTAGLMLLPILAYAIFLISLSVAGGFWISSLLLISLCIALISLLSIILALKLRQNRKEVSFFHFRFLNGFSRPHYLFFPEHLFRNELVLLLLSKVYTCSMIMGTAQLYSTDTFDIRLMTTGILLSLVGNVAILHNYVWFHYHKMVFSLNLPFSAFHALRNHAIIITLLIISELALILRHYPLAYNLYDVSGLIGFAIGTTSITFALLIYRQKELSRSILSLFWVIVFSTVIILFSVHPLILGSIGILISIGVMYLRHDKFEYIERN